MQTTHGFPAYYRTWKGTFCHVCDICHKKVKYEMTQDEYAVRLLKCGLVQFTAQILFFRV